MTTNSRKLTTKQAGKAAVEVRSKCKRAKKGDRLINLLKARSSRSIAILSAERDWKPHSTHTALSRLRNAGYVIEKSPPDKQGGARYKISCSPADAAQ